MVAIVAAVATYMAASPVIQTQQASMANKHAKSVSEENSRIAARDAAAAERAFNAANRKKPNLFALLPNNRKPMIPGAGSAATPLTGAPIGSTSLLGG